MDVEVLQSDENCKSEETEEESFVAGIISDALNTRSCSLDLKNRNLKEIPDRISDLPNLQVGNDSHKLTKRDVEIIYFG